MPKPERPSAAVARRIFNNPENVDPNDALTLARAHISALASLRMFRTLIATCLVVVVVLAGAFGVAMAAYVTK